MVVGCTPLTGESMRWIKDTVTGLANPHDAAAKNRVSKVGVKKRGPPQPAAVRRFPRDAQASTDTANTYKKACYRHRGSHTRARNHVVFRWLAACGWAMCARRHGNRCVQRGWMLGVCVEDGILLLMQSCLHLTNAFSGLFRCLPARLSLVLSLLYSPSLLLYHSRWPSTCSKGET